MSTPQPFYGYVGFVWAVAYGAYLYLGEFITTNPAADQIYQVANLVYTILNNSCNAINANLISNAWTSELVNLQAIEALPLSVPSSVTAALTNRTTAISNAIIGLNSIIPSATVTTVPILLNQNISTIATCDLLSFFNNFDYETPPTGTTNSNLIAAAQTLASDFNTLALAISGYQGTQTTLYDTAYRLYVTAQMTADILSSFTSGALSTSLSSTSNWNQLVTVPALVSDAYMIATPPYTVAAQQEEIIRYLLLTLSLQLAWYLLILRQPGSGNINLATVMQGQSLMDVAAQNLGNFEEWTNIASINNLYPPYVGTTASPGIVAWGNQVVLPSGDATQAPIGTIPNYATNFLGVDLYLGQINGDMPPWSGDFQTISGYNNLNISLGRRLQTTIGSLIYHSTYGSRIPPQVGVPQTSATAGLITTFGNSAILSDPRVASIIKSATQILPNFALLYQASVAPAGLGSTPISVNEVLNPVA